MNRLADEPRLADLPLALDVKTTARLTGVSPDAIYEAVSAGTCPWPAFRVGRTIRIPREAVLASLGLKADGE
jgi:excisionase family DNA binding protein